MKELISIKMETYLNLPLTKVKNSDEQPIEKILLYNNI